ncbi:hypothetical protein GLOTRDRAFT_122491 [Gloeophyllum trabeum ATCC 11539]|uniref:GmrSD restriction endonucleases N-terminal domain-containing protein n=1 Tax=Gloeophyllum trabeum (strain ATCC 11539 / FP-39264 / Madison 617) TaxID=670483 RepID=S7Q0N4_GLOTA|nr:uncharacterized protein GLOTRDRAFT_122491 [Gloeophyllum trabeum ATCC 11539]EPQ53323.1 hypothetical protein GLOTRDRAFT_122491 [Gloeophyllum trabeum ATCC 11539]
MSSDESDLTDLDYDEGEIQEESRQTRNGKGGTAKNGRKVRKVLSKPRTVHYTPQSLFEQIHNGDIDLNPDYQREVVWPETKQSAVVDSFLRHFYVPPVIFSVNVDEDGIEHRTCIDGKQRLTSIVNFTNEKYWFKENPQAARAHKLLPDKYRKEWGRIQVVCIEYDGLHESEEREIFQRVQMGMALTPSEKLQAISSPKASFVREILATYSELTTDWDSSRGNDFRCVAQALLNIDKYPLKSGGTIMQVEKWLNTEVDLDEDVKDDYRRTFGVFVDLLRDKTLSKCLRTPTTIAPVEFVMICLLIAREKDRLTLAQLSNVILDMRRDVRANHKDIRLNSLVMKTMVTFIGGIKPSKVKDGGGEPAGRKVLSAPKRKLKEDDETGGSKVQKNLEGPMKVQAPTPETGRGPRGSPANGPLASQVKQEAGSGNTFPQPTGDPKISSPRPLTPSIPPVPDRLAAIRFLPPPSWIHPLWLGWLFFMATRISKEGGSLIQVKILGRGTLNLVQILGSMEEVVVQVKTPDKAIIMQVEILGVMGEALIHISQGIRIRDGEVIIDDAV